jgi:hypothetical protein
MLDGGEARDEERGTSRGHCGRIVERPAGLGVGAGTVEAYLTPAGFGSSFHVVGSTDIIKPKHVEVVFPDTGERVTTLDVPGFDESKHATVRCTYTDPAGLFVEFTGVRS